MAPGTTAAEPPAGSGLAVQPHVGPAPVEPSPKLDEDPTSENTPEPQPIPDAAAPDAASKSSTHRPTRPESVVGRAAGQLVRTVNELLGSLHERVAGVSERIGKAADGMARAVSAMMAGLLGGGDGASGPADEPLVPYVPVPAAPPPTAPIPVGGPSFSGGSTSSWSLSSAADHEKLLQLFAVLALFSLALMQGGERRWITREPLSPSMLARPPNDRPG